MCWDWRTKVSVASSPLSLTLMISITQRWTSLGKVIDLAAPAMNDFDAFSGKVCARHSRLDLPLWPPMTSHVIRDSLGASFCLTIGVPVPDVALIDAERSDSIALVESEKAFSCVRSSPRPLRDSASG